MKFDFHLKSGKTITLDFPGVNAASDLSVQAENVTGADGTVFIENIEAITIHAEPANPRMLIDVDGDVWTEVVSDQWRHPDLAGLRTLAQIKEEFGPLKQGPR